MISLCMIVKNEEKFLHDCLESVKGVVGEIIIVDTGSTDNTLQIAQKFGAKIFSFKWIGDFSAARNISLSHASGDWILYLDADERISPQSLNELKKITSGSASCAYNCNIINIDECGKRPSVMLYPRLFPNKERVRFTGKVHEQIDISLLENGYPISNSSIEIIHLGYSISEEDKQKKAERNLKLLEVEYKKNSSSYYAFQLGQTLGILRRKKEAEYYFNIALTDRNLNKEYASVAYRYIALNSAERNEFDRALEYIEKSVNADSDQPLNLMAAAKIYAHLKMESKASEAALKSYHANEKFLNKAALSAQNILMDAQELCMHGLEVSVSILNQELFRFFFEKINKNSLEPVTQLFNDLFTNNRISDEQIIDSLPGISEIYIKPILLLLSNYSHQESRKVLLIALANKFDNAAEIHFELAKYYLLAANNLSAESEIEKAIRINKNDPTPYFYLISIYLQTGKIHKILAMLETMDSLFGNSPEVAPRLQMLKEKLVSAMAE